MFTALLLFSLLLLSALLYMLARSLRQARQNAQRERMEDGLKHLYDSAAQGRPATLESLAGSLGIAPDEALRLYLAMASEGLSQFKEDQPVLTPKGRSMALHMVRVHRLIERYLSEQTGIPQPDWHRRAHKLEHRMSDDQLAWLTKSLGDPIFDPHGDPIPDAEGNLPEEQVQGRTLADLEVGASAEVAHIEDEPAAIYAQISACGINPGSIIQVLDRTAASIRIAADGIEHTLAPIFARNIEISQSEVEADSQGVACHLSQLPEKAWAQVRNINRNCRGLARSRLLDLGFTPGAKVCAEFRSPGGDPTAYRVRGALIALRREQADLILVEPRDTSA